MVYAEIRHHYDDIKTDEKVEDKVEDKRVVYRVVKEPGKGKVYRVVNKENLGDSGSSSKIHFNIRDSLLRYGKIDIWITFNSTHDMLSRDYLGGEFKWIKYKINIDGSRVVGNSGIKSIAYNYTQNLKSDGSADGKFQSELNIDGMRKNDDILKGELDDFSNYLYERGGLFPSLVDIRDRYLKVGGISVIYDRVGDKKARYYGVSEFKRMFSGIYLRDTSEDRREKDRKRLELLRRYRNKIRPTEYEVSRIELLELRKELKNLDPKDKEHRDFLKGRIKELEGVLGRYLDERIERMEDLKKVEDVRRKEELGERIKDLRKELENLGEGNEESRRVLEEKIRELEGVFNLGSVLVTGSEVLRDSVVEEILKRYGLYRFPTFLNSENDILHFVRGVLHGAWKDRGLNFGKRPHGLSSEEWKKKVEEKYWSDLRILADYSLSYLDDMVNRIRSKGGDHWLLDSGNLSRAKSLLRDGFLAGNRIDEAVKFQSPRSSGARDFVNLLNKYGISIKKIPSKSELIVLGRVFGRGVKTISDEWIKNRPKGMSKNDNDSRVEMIKEDRSKDIKRMDELISEYLEDFRDRVEEYNRSGNRISDTDWILDSKERGDVEEQFKRNILVIRDFEEPPQESVRMMELGKFNELVAFANQKKSDISHLAARLEKRSTNLFGLVNLIKDLKKRITEYRSKLTDISRITDIDVLEEEMYRVNKKIWDIPIESISFVSDSKHNFEESSKFLESYFELAAKYSALSDRWYSLLDELWKSDKKLTDKDIKVKKIEESKKIKENRSLLQKNLHKISNEYSANISVPALHSARNLLKEIDLFSEAYAEIKLSYWFRTKYNPVLDTPTWGIQSIQKKSSEDDFKSLLDGVIALCNRFGGYSLRDADAIDHIIPEIRKKLELLINNLMEKRSLELRVIQGASIDGVLSSPIESGLSSFSDFSKKGDYNDRLIDFSKDRNQNDSLVDNFIDSMSFTVRDKKKLEEYVERIRKEWNELRSTLYPDYTRFEVNDYRNQKGTSTIKAISELTDKERRFSDVSLAAFFERWDGIIKRNKYPSKDTLFGLPMNRDRKKLYLSLSDIFKDIHDARKVIDGLGKIRGLDGDVLSDQAEKELEELERAIVDRSKEKISERDIDLYSRRHNVSPSKAKEDLKRRLKNFPKIALGAFIIRWGDIAKHGVAPREKTPLGTLPGSKYTNMGKFVEKAIPNLFNLVPPEVEKEPVPGKGTDRNIRKFYEDSIFEDVEYTSKEYSERWYNELGAPGERNKEEKGGGSGGSKSRPKAIKPPPPNATWETIKQIVGDDLKTKSAKDIVLDVMVSYSDIVNIEVMRMLRKNDMEEDPYKFEYIEVDDVISGLVTLLRSLAWAIQRLIFSVGKWEQSRTMKVPYKGDVLKIPGLTNTSDIDFRKMELSRPQGDIVFSSVEEGIKYFNKILDIYKEIDYYIHPSSVVGWKVNRTESPKVDMRVIRQGKEFQDLSKGLSRYPMNLFPFGLLEGIISLGKPVKKYALDMSYRVISGFCGCVSERNIFL